MFDLVNSVTILGAASRIKERGFSDSIIKEVLPSVHKQLDSHVQEGGILVIR
jgi:hypothetical protein